jgi:hypothetical protein
MKINENKRIQSIVQRMNTGSQRLKRPDLLYDSVEAHGNGLLRLVEVAFPWPWIDSDGQTLKKAYRKNVGKSERPIVKIERVCPNQTVEQSTIVIGATGVFHKQSQVEFAKATRLQKKQLARYQRNPVDMAIQGWYQVFVESMERAKHHRDNPPKLEEISILAEHGIDLAPGEDEDPVDLKSFSEDDITGIEAHQASVAVRDVAMPEKALPPPLEEHPDGQMETPPK